MNGSHVVLTMEDYNKLIEKVDEAKELRADIIRAVKVEEPYGETDSLTVNVRFKGTPIGDMIMTEIDKQMVSKKLDPSLYKINKDSILNNHAWREINLIKEKPVSSEDEEESADE